MTPLRPRDDPSRAIVLANPSMAAVMDSLRRNFRGVVDGSLARIITVFSGRHLETPAAALTIRSLVMELGFRLEASTQRYTSLTRSFPAPSHLVGAARAGPSSTVLAATRRPNDT